MRRSFMIFLTFLVPTQTQLLNQIITTFMMNYINIETNYNPSISHLIPGAFYSQDHFTSPFVCSNLLYSCTSRAKATIVNEDSSNYISSKPAVGFDYTNGPLWSIMCIGTPYGNVAGKLTKDKRAFYSWGASELECDHYEVKFGELVYHSAPIPDDCKPSVFQLNDKEYYYHVVVNSKYGMIPGKGQQDGKAAWYSFGGKEFRVTRNFYIIC